MKQIVFYSSVFLLSFNANAGLPTAHDVQGLSGGSSSTNGLGISASVATDTICDGTTVTFAARMANGCVPSYQWLLNGNPIPGATADTFITGSLTTGDTISVEAAAAPACGLTVNTVSNWISFNVIAPPAAPGPIAGSATPCGGTVETYSIAPVAGATSYVWTMPSSWAGSGKDTAAVFTVGSSGAIMVEAINACGSSQQSVLQVNPQAVPPALAPITGSQLVCAGGAEAYTVLGPGWSNFIWTLPAGWSGTSTGNTINCTAGSAGGFISVAATSVCGANAVINMPVTVNAYVTPTTSISTANKSVCSGARVIFLASATNGGALPDYQWMLNGNILNASGSSFAIDSLKNGDVVMAILTSSEQCLSVNGVSSNPLSMSVLPMVMPDVQISSNRTMPVPSGLPVTFTASYIGAGTTPRFQWLKNGLPIAFETHSTYTVANPTHGDMISVRMTSSALCPTQAEVTADGIAVRLAASTGLHETASTWNGKVSLYPNPSTGTFFLVGDWASPGQGQDVQVDLLNMMGQSVYSTTLKTDGAQWRLEVQAGEGLSNGMYQLRLRSQGMLLSRSVLIQR